MGREKRRVLRSTRAQRSSSPAAWAYAVDTVTPTPMPLNSSISVFTSRTEML